MSVQPIVSSLDVSRLQPLLTGRYIDAAVLRLRALLDRARSVPPRRVPPDVVTMNSRVLVRHPGDEAPDMYELAYPNSDSGGLSVLSPLGAALLGAREGEVVECAGGRVSRRATVERIEYQPERERHYDR
ncbi:MAG: GreA/GreB family elongation factor [Phycisphaerales bacterium]|nr:GreA/GreB family elongation factor [Phycisphaerales bacterium]